MKLVVGLLTAVTVSGGAHAASYTFEGGPVDVPAEGPANPSFVQVEGVQGNVTSVSITLRGLQHSYSGDELVVVLTDPNGYAAALLDGVACSFYGTGAVVLADDAPGSVRTGCNGSLQPGRYNLSATPGRAEAFTIPIAPGRPFLQSLSELGRPNPDGRWILWAEDFVSGDAGGIASWAITVETDAPEPDEEGR